MTAEAKYNRELKSGQIVLEDVEEALESREKEEIEVAYERICEIIKKLEISKDKSIEEMLGEEKTIDQVREWNKEQKEKIKEFRNMRKRLKEQLDGFRQKETEQKKEDELQHQRRLMEEQATIDRKREQEKEEVKNREREREEQWYSKKLEMEMEMAKKRMEEEKARPQSVKLQKYTITPFKGDYKDWLRFWNQFVIEVDGSSIADISKFNYLLELVEGKPKEDILGLPHTEDGYKEAKRILEKIYGKDMKIHKALIKELEGLESITSIHHTARVHDYYNKMSRIVRTLVTMKRLESAQSYVYTLLDKLGPVKEALIQKDDEWENWDLEQLVENLEKYVDRHPLPAGVTMSSATSMKKRGYEYQTDEKRGDRMMLANSIDKPKGRPTSCVFCELTNHRSSDCNKVLNLAQRRDIVKRKKLCFNCTGFGHMASKCRSRGCRKCGGRHHTSLCDGAALDSTSSSIQQPEMGKRALDTSTTLHATVMAMVNGIPARIMIDSGASSSYICTSLVTRLHLKPVQAETRSIEQMYGTVKRRVQIYKVTVQSMVIKEYSLELNCINGEKDILTYLPNPNLKALKKKYSRLSPLHFSDESTEEEKLPVHIILGAADYQRIKTTEPPVLGPNPDVDPGAEFTMLGWTVTGKTMEVDSEVERIFLMLSPKEEFEKMCSIEVLGLADTDSGPEDRFHENFKGSLQRLVDGTYSTRLPWKDHMELPTYRTLAVARLHSTTRRLEKLQKLEEYHEVMEAQIKDGILELIPEEPSGEIIHYVPHQPVIREDAESTKMRIVYDCSARSCPEDPSLNDCLEKGPPLQPLILDILLRNRMLPLCITGDIKKAFLQIKLDPADRDAQRLFWYNNLEERKMVAYRFTRVIFGAASSPYILGATLEKHLSQYRETFPETVKALLNNTYVDDVQFGGHKREDLLNFKAEATQILQEGGFELHKWHSNVPEAEVPIPEVSMSEEEDTTTYAKTAIGTKSCETKILGIPWNKKNDEFTISLSKCADTGNEVVLTKRKMLSVINSVFDPLGLASPVIITAKLLYSRVCKEKLAWDEEIKSEISALWKNWIKKLTKCPSLRVPRSVIQGEVTHITLHGFADASKLAVAACVYMVTHYNNQEPSQHLLTAKARVAPEKSIPRLELVAAHTLSKLIVCVKEALADYQIEEIHGWVDSTTVLHWLKGKGTWSQFVRNRVKAISSSDIEEWHYVPTGENPSDLGSRGIAPAQMGSFWFCGPNWLSCKGNWPIQPEIRESQETEAERLPKKERLLHTKEETTSAKEVKELLEKYKLWKTLRITAFILRFVTNCRRKKKQTGMLTTEEIESAERFWIKEAQQVEEIQSDVPLKKDQQGIWRCDGRVPDYHPIFLPRSHTFVKLLIEQTHGRMLHGGVSVTMSCIRERFWIPKLRTLVKKVIHNCNKCKRFRVQGLAAPRNSQLPTFRSQMTDPFACTGVDFAGPVKYRVNKKTVGKAYIALFTCATTRAVHLKLCRDLTAEEFQRAMKEFVARRGTPRLMVSDNGKTFTATKKWLSKLKKNEELMNYLATEKISWRLNLSRAPWWGGFFERLIGTMKRSLAKAIGGSILKFAELEETLLDTECVMNNRPLCYQGEDFETPVITPNILIRGKPAQMLEEDLYKIGDDETLPKRMIFLARSKKQLRKRWLKEYLYALEERKHSQNKSDVEIPEIGKVVLLKEDIKNRAHWKIGRVIGKIIGKDGVTRGMKIKLGNGYIVERPRQLVCDLEVGGENRAANVKLNPRAQEFRPRERLPRKARDDAKNQMAAVKVCEDQED